MGLTRIFGKEHLADILRMADVIEAVESAYCCHFTSSTKISRSSTKTSSSTDGFSLDSVSGFSKELNTASIYVSASSPGDISTARNPFSSSVFLLFENRTGDLLGIFDGRELTLLRAAGASAIAAKLFARRDERTMLLIGAGNLAASMVKGTADSLPYLKHICVTSRDPRRTENFVRSQSIRYPHIRFSDFPIYDLKEIAPRSKYVVTATSSEAPLLKKEWISPGTHITAAGANSPDKQELDPRIFMGARVFVDNREQTTLTGECRSAFRNGLIGESDMHEIGGVLAGKTIGRTRDDEITIFDMTGTPLEDMMLGRLALKRAAYRNIGEVLEIIRVPDIV